MNRFLFRGKKELLIAATFLGLALALLCARPALAHARLVRSNPVDKAQLEKAPAVIEMWFNELLDEGFHQVSVFPAKEIALKQRSNLAKGKPAVDPKDRTKLSVEVQALTPGEYMVEYRVLSRDGHSAPGRFTFRVLAPK